jgi:hypothetical protein
MRELDDMTGAIVAAALQMHRRPGPRSAGVRVRDDSDTGARISFVAPTLREGLRRIVNAFQPSAAPRLRVNQGVSAT